MFELTDVFGDKVNIGDIVIASRPAGAGTTTLQLCRVKTITERSVGIVPVNRDGSDQTPEQMRYGYGPCNLQKSYRDKTRCVKIARYPGNA